MSALAAAVGAASGLVGGCLVPPLIARIPEPAREEGAAVRAEPAPLPDAAPPHTELPDQLPDTAAPHAGPVDPEPGHAEPGQRGHAAPGSSSPQQGAPRAGRALPPAPPKEPYAAIARIPGLGWRAALVGTVAGGLLGWSLGWSWALLVWLPLVPIGVALAVVDWRTTLLPTRVIAPAYALVVAITLVAAVAEGDRGIVVHAAVGWVVMGGVFLLLWLAYPRGLGYGDVRLSGVLGIALGQLGWPELLTGMYAGFLLGGVTGAVLAALRLVDRRRFPFGPFLLLGALAGVLAGPGLARGLGY